MIQKPPMCSFDSANGPSVSTAAPLSIRTTVAVSGGSRPPANTQAPAPRSSSLNVSTAAKTPAMASGSGGGASWVPWTDSRYWVISVVSLVAGSVVVVGEDRDAALRGRALAQAQRPLRRTGEQPLAGAHDHRMDHQPVFVDQAERRQLVHQVAAAVDQHVTAVLGPERLHGVAEIASQQRRVPLGRLQGA